MERVMKVWFTPPGLKAEGVTWSTTRTDDEYIAALIALDTRPHSRIDKIGGESA